MMKFECKMCGARPENANLRVTRVVEIGCYGNRLASEWDEFILGDDDIDRHRLFCPKCGGRITVVDEPCQHVWGEVKFGYGNNKGQVMRQCDICGIEQIGIAQPVWERE